MRSSSAVVLMIVLTALVFAQKEKATDGFVPLFKGKDLKGWEFLNCSAKDWQVEDGVLSTVAGKGRGWNSWLLSEAFYEDFELRLEYQLATKGANSGIGLRAESRNPSGNGIEIQIVDDDAYPKYKADEKNGALVDIAGPARKAGKPLGQWNRLHVTLVGRKLTVALNGVAVHDVDLNGLAGIRHAGLRRESGHIGLQTNTGIVKFRDVQIKPLGKSAKASPASGSKLTLTLDPGRHTSQILRTFFNPEDGNQLITLSDDGAVRLWDVAQARTTSVIYPPGVPYVSKATMSRDGKRLAVPSRYIKDGRPLNVIYVLSLPAGRIENILRGYPTEVSGLDFSPDGKLLAVGTGHGAWVSDLVRGDEPRSIRKGNSVVGVAFDPDGKRLACTFWANGGAIHDLKSGDELAKLVFGGYNSRLAWSPDGKTLATVTGSQVRLHDEKGQLLRTASHSGGGLDLRFSPDSQKLLVVGEDGRKQHRATLLDVESAKVLVAFAPDSVGSLCGAFSPDGKSIATAGGRIDWLPIFLWDAKDGQITGRFPLTGRFPPGESWIFGGAGYEIPGWKKDGTAVCWLIGPKEYRPSKDLMRSYATFDLAGLGFTETLEKGMRHWLPLPEDDLTERDGLSLERNSTFVAVSQGGKAIRMLEGGLATKHLGKGLVASRFNAAGDPFVRVTNVFTGQYGVLSPDGRYLVQLRIKGTQTLGIVPAQGTKPLLTLYRKGSDWVIWTEEGYYAATPGGELLMGWKVDNGIHKMPSFYPASRFNKLHRPDVIRKAFELGSVKAALEALDGKAAKVQNVEESLPPSAVVEVVKQAADRVTFRVTAKARSKGQPVTAVRLMLDGLPFPGVDAHRPPTPAAEVAWTDTVTLPPGEHTLAALVRSEDASARSEPVIVKWVAPQQRPTLHVLTVGIDDYTGGVPKLSCAANDARDVAKAFAAARKGDLFKDVIIHEALTDRAATSKAVRDKLAALKKAVSREDVVVVFLAGHGTLSGGDFYFLTHDSAAAKIDDATALSGRRLADGLGGLGCRVLLLLDACHSGAAGLKAASDDAARGLSDDDVGVTVLAAAQGKQKAGEKDGNGLFTRAIKEAFADPSPAPCGRDGRLFVHHLYAHVSDRVGELSDFKQNPFLRSPDGVPPFALRQFDAK